MDILKSGLKQVEKGLGDFLADTYALYLKTQNFHWNLKGPNFFSLHLLFQKQYEDLAEAADEIAERIQSLGFYVEGTFSAFQKRTSIPEAKKNLSEKKMIQELLAGHEKISGQIRPLIAHFQEVYDEASADLLIKRLGVHEKAAWMLRSHLIPLPGK
ncbi:MAG: DNA starvation/stationary phase protection protein [Chlamydiia bacterium]|nr:DNA starvation/stationary phase protection protein [Chlamydiia bacterium]